MSNEEIQKQINKVQLIEDMSIIGTIMKEEILREKKSNPENFYTNEEIINNKKDEQLYALGIFSKILENQGIVSAIKKNTNEEEKKAAINNIQFLINGISDKNKYNFHFEFGTEKNIKLLNDDEEKKIFHNKLRKKLSKILEIDEEEIIIIFPRYGTYQVSVIFNSIDFELNEEELTNKFKNEKDELGKLKQIEKGIILDGCLLTPDMLDHRGNNMDGGWAKKGHKRGGEDYDPPSGWIGYGLKVKGSYENDIWLGMQNIEGEWCVAYHGVARLEKDPKNVSKITGNIIKTKFKPSTKGKCTYKEDIRHPGNKCGLGVYCTPKINYAEGYSGETEFNGVRYKCALMLRIKPDKIRQCKEYPDEYILEPTTDEIRPYRILLKEV